VGDVAMLVARLVGPTEEVVGVEREASSVARAKGRVAEAGLHYVSFTQKVFSALMSLLTLSDRFSAEAIAVASREELGNSLLVLEEVGVAYVSHQNACAGGQSCFLDL